MPIHIKVIKSARKLYVIRDDAIIAEYDIDLGQNPVGKKRFSGDTKTPTGKYKICTRNDHSNYFHALKISYPNLWDWIYALLHLRSPGNLIMIHGLTTNPNLPSYKKFKSREYTPGMDWTVGCIAMRSNADMLEIWRTIPLKTTIIITE